MWAFAYRAIIEITGADGVVPGRQTLLQVGTHPMKERKKESGMPLGVYHAWGNQAF